MYYTLYSMYVSVLSVDPRMPCDIYKSVNDESRITEYSRRLLSLFKVSQCIKAS
jgi:hypothetical protein